VLSIKVEDELKWRIVMNRDMGHTTLMFDLMLLCMAIFMGMWSALN